MCPPSSYVLGMYYLVPLVCNVYYVCTSVLPSGDGYVPCSYSRFSPAVGKTACRLSGCGLSTPLININSTATPFCFRKVLGISAALFAAVKGVKFVASFSFFHSGKFAQRVSLSFTYGLTNLKKSNQHFKISDPMTPFSAGAIH